MDLLIQLLIVVVVAGVLVYLFNNIFTTIDPRFKLVANCLIGIGLFLFVLGIFGYGPIHVGGVFVEHRR